jgi:hypothetical protein
MTNSKGPPVVVDDATSAEQAVQNASAGGITRSVGERAEIDTLPNGRNEPKTYVKPFMSAVYDIIEGVFAHYSSNA